LFIDEPEIGLEPQVQRNFLRVLKTVAEGSASGHKKRIEVATHSHLFVDRVTIDNNYVVTKENDGSARIRSISTEPELHDLVFRLLGNSPSDLFFPKNIVIVEGPSDREYLNRILVLKGITAIAIHYAEGAENVDVALPAIDQMLRTTAYLPLYRGRICILVDKQSRREVVQKWRQYLGDTSGKRVIELEKGDVEQYYPAAILGEITGLQGTEMETGLAEYLKRVKKGERSPQMGKFRGGKIALARAVAERMTEAHLPDVDQGIIGLLEEARRLSDAN